ncbi:MAG: 7-carboxy-7-deazaguanine synthase [Gemmatimonadales bacterium]
MTYAVKEIYYTLQGEGAQTGRAAVFCRFAGCNLWSGREADRGGAVCQFCDTDFVGVDGDGGGRFETAADLAARVAAAWPGGAGRRYVVCTGGEPLLQLDAAAVQAFHSEGFEVAIETNGTLPVPPGVDWVCVSPKAGAPLQVSEGDELKLVYPQTDAPPERFSRFGFRHFFLQPMDGPHRVEHTQRAIDYCLRHPQWRLSLQTHKLTGLR